MLSFSFFFLFLRECVHVLFYERGQSALFRTVLSACAQVFLFFRCVCVCFAILCSPMSSVCVCACRCASVYLISVCVSTHAVAKISCPILYCSFFFNHKIRLKKKKEIRMMLFFFFSVCACACACASWMLAAYVSYNLHSSR